MDVVVAGGNRKERERDKECAAVAAFARGDINLGDRGNTHISQ